ncbi:MAG: MerR family transcriptional regulator [Chloroflexi bacterium]|nr:MAG: MerR family transcriptional regulator [Chloroflexota bacterium]
MDTRRDPLTMPPLPWRVGELARRTGLSVRTLHHWGDLTLLVPSHRSPAGHRLYTAADISRLQQIVALRGLGLALTEIRDVLADPRTTPAAVLKRRLERSRAHLALEEQLCRRLERATAALEAGAGDLPVDQTVLSIEVMTMIDRHYSPEQREQQARRRELLDEQRIQAAQNEWAELVDDVRTALARGTDPRSVAGQQLAERWNGLVGEFTGGDPGIERSLRSIYQAEPQAVVTPIGVDHRDVYGFIARASLQPQD